MHSVGPVQLSSIEQFCKAAELGSFSLAAQALGLTPATISRSVRRIEDRLGARLFSRTTRRIQLTHEGTLYYSACQQALQKIASAEQIITGKPKAHTAALSGEKDDFSASTLEEVDQQLATIYRISPVGISITELSSGTFVDVNDALLSMLGYSREEVIGHTSMELGIWPKADDRQSVLGHMLETTRHEGIDCRFRRKDGLIRDFMVSASIIELKGNACALFMLTDISDRKEAERALARESERNQMLLRNTGDGIHIIDCDGNLLEVSDSFCKLLGYTRREVIGMNISAIDANFDLAGVQKIIAAQLASPLLTTFETIHRRKDGCLIDVEVTGIPVELDGQFLLFNSSRDISNRKQIEAALLESQELLKHLANQVPGTLYQYRLYPDGSACIPYASDGFEEMYEISPEAVRTDAWLTRARWHPDDADLMVNSIRASAATLTDWRCEFRVNLPRQGLRWRLGQARPERLEDGSVLWHGLITDITDRKQAEAELSRYRDHLEELLKERTQDLEAARIAAEQANRAKSDFLTNASHEMRTPLHQVSALAQLIRRESLSARQTERLEKLQEANKRLTSIIDGVLKLTDLESRSLSIEQKPVDVAMMMTQVYEMYTNQAASKKLELELCVEELPEDLMGDAVQLQTALLNYVQNALAFTNQGRITLRAVCIENGESQAVICFEVEDTGPGIASDQLPHLFAIFHQGDASQSRSHGGMGIGLATTKKLANLMGGDAGCTSQIGKGSLFWFTARLNKAACF